MLPTSNGAVVTLLALMSGGRVPAMINFTSGAANILGACRAAEIDTVLTARAFVEKARLEKLIAQIEKHVHIVYLEDVRKTVSFRRQAARGAAGEKAAGRAQAGRLGVILFTSGTEGVPKGVVLSHRNVLTNVAQAEARIDFGREDKLFMALPAFHSFGFMGGIVLPLISGVPTYFYPSPLHYRTVPELVYGICADLPLRHRYVPRRLCTHGQSVRFPLAALHRRRRRADQGIDPPDLSGKIRHAHSRRLRRDRDRRRCLALNTPMFNKFGTVGRLLPGIAGAAGEGRGRGGGAGRLFVKGPNVMLGYLRADKPGVLEPPPEGWYDTGDIVAIDEQGYVAIKGRAKRFAKIGGEMISLAAVEMLAAELWPNYNSAVVALPDARKGERLILVTDKHSATRADFQAYARSKHASELMSPARGHRARQAAAARLRQARSAGAAEIGARLSGGQGRRGGVSVPLAAAVGSHGLPIRPRVRLKSWRAEISREESLQLILGPFRELTRKRDFYAGGLMLLIGLGVALKGWSSYRLGTLMHMGPGFLPTALGVHPGVDRDRDCRWRGRTGERRESEADERILPEHPQWWGWFCILAGPALLHPLRHYFGG